MNIKEELLEIVCEYVDVPAEDIDFESNMKHAAGINSFVFLSMISDIESHFNTHIPNEALMEFRSLGDIVRFLENR